MFEDFIESVGTFVEIVTARKELATLVTNELKSKDIKWSTKFANTVLEDDTYTEKEVEDGEAICDLFTKTYTSNMGVFNKSTEPYELWKVGELFFVRKDNEDDIQRVKDIILSDRTVPSRMYLVTVSEGELVAEKVNTHKFITTHRVLDRPIPTIVNKKEEEPVTAAKEEEVKPNKILTLSTLQNHMRAMLDNVQPDKLEEVIIGSRTARAIFCNMYPVKYELFTRYTATFLSIEPEDFSDDMNRLATRLTIIFSFVNIDLNALLLAYVIYHYHDNAELDINNVVYNIIEVAKTLREQGDI